jgi:hypothetical protein
LIYRAASGAVDPNEAGIGVSYTHASDDDVTAVFGIRARLLY